MATCEKQVLEPIPPARYVLGMNQREAAVSLRVLTQGTHLAGDDALHLYAVIKALREALGS